MKPKVAFAIVLIAGIAIAFDGGISISRRNIQQLLAAPAPNNVPIGWIVEARGEVLLKRQNWLEYHSAGVGIELYYGDLLQPTNGATIVVRCAANNIRWRLPAGAPSGASNGCPLPPPLQPRCGNTLCPRGGAIVLNPDIPYIISPRRTTLLTDKPILRWNSVLGAKSYTVSVKGESEGDSWKIETNSNEVVYSGKQPLKPGVYYQLIVEADTGRSSQEEGVSGLGFQILNDSESQLIKVAAQKLEAEELNEDAKALSLAYLYIRNDLIADAIATIEPLVNKRSKTPAVYSLLGNLYQQVGLSPLAEPLYLKALALASTRDIELQATTAVALAEIYAANEKTDKAIEYLDLALTKYKVLGDKERIKEVENQREQLKK